MTAIVPTIRNAFRRTADKLTGRHVPVRSGQPPIETWTGRPIRTPKLDVLERDGEMRVALDVPGAALERTTVTSGEQGVLVVHAVLDHGADWHLRLALPAHADVANARSALRHGVLTIDIPLRPAESKVHRIPVRSA